MEKKVELNMPSAIGGEDRVHYPHFLVTLKRLKDEWAGICKRSRVCFKKRNKNEKRKEEEVEAVNIFEEIVVNYVDFTII
jgi:hypothetical protein